MAYYIDLFSPETYEAFMKSDQTVSGFRERQKGVAQNIKPGDKLVCYITRLSRWAAILEVTSDYFIDEKPIFTQENDPFIVRFKVKPIVLLPLDKTIPIEEDSMWKNLSFTKGPKVMGWTAMVRGSLRKMEESDGQHIERALLEIEKSEKKFSLTEADLKKLKSFKIKTQDSKEVAVSVPDDDLFIEKEGIVQAPRESIKYQALLAEIGDRMNFKIWIPKGDRQRVLENWKGNENSILDSLPLNYDDVTLKTIENIDILWIKRRSIIRAFEVEHTTSIYSGILRMADLMALQPNLEIKAHIVAPIDRKEKVHSEITRPVFTLLEKGPLAESCSFLSYDSINELYNEKMLGHMSDSVLEEYAEYAEADYE